MGHEWKKLGELEWRRYQWLGDAVEGRGNTGFEAFAHHSLDSIGTKMHCAEEHNKDGEFTDIDGVLLDLY